MLNRDFARNFTQHFPELAAKYPVYSELQNVFDLALVGAMMRSEKLADRVDWHLQYFGDPQQFAIELGQAPKLVDSVMNHRMVNKFNILVGVSGGVSCDPAKLVEPKAIELDYGRLREEERAASGPKARRPSMFGGGTNCGTGLRSKRQPAATIGSFHLRRFAVSPTRDCATLRFRSR